MGGEHKCSVCEATFTRPQHVARHMRSHTGDRPYKCQFCPDQFARSDLLSRHVNKCHEASKPPVVAGPPGRKPSRAALRATTSKQICDQCVKGSLSCDGAKPCVRCTQRKIRCTFVEFNRQTAPAGPGHPDDVTTSVHPPPLPPPPPFSTTALAPPPPPGVDLLYPEMAGDYTKQWPTDAHQHQQQQQQQQQFYPDYAWSQADNDLQHFVSSISSTLVSADCRRGSVDYGGSAGSTSIPSSASSSSSHLPVEDNNVPFQMHTSEFSAYQQPVDETQAPAFHSAFGVLSIHDPDAAPFFSSSDTTALTDLNATPMSRDDLSCWSHFLPHAPSTPRRRAASMFTMRTPLAAPAAASYIPPQPQPQPQHTYAAPVHAAVPLETLSSWSAKIHAQPPPDLHLSIPASKLKARRQTLSGGAPSCSAYTYRTSASPVDPYSRSSSSSSASTSTTSWDSFPPRPDARRPSFKRLPSTTPLEHDREHKRVFISSYASSSLSAAPQSNTNTEHVVVPKIEETVVNLSQQQQQLQTRRRATSSAQDNMFNLHLGGPGGAFIE